MIDKVHPGLVNLFIDQVRREYERTYAAYKRVREEMKELYNVKSNVEHLLNIPERDDDREREITRR